MKNVLLSLSLLLSPLFCYAQASSIDICKAFYTDTFPLNHKIKRIRDIAESSFEGEQDFGEEMYDRKGRRLKRLSLYKHGGVLDTIQNDRYDYDSDTLNVLITGIKGSKSVLPKTCPHRIMSYGHLRQLQNIEDAPFKLSREILERYQIDTLSEKDGAQKTITFKEPDSSYIAAKAYIDKAGRIQELIINPTKENWYRITWLYSNNRLMRRDSSAKYGLECTEERIKKDKLSIKVFNRSQEMSKIKYDMEYEYNLDGSLPYKRSWTDDFWYEYDEKGCLIETIVVRRSTQITWTTRYEYEFYDD